MIGRGHEFVPPDLEGRVHRRRLENLAAEGLQGGENLRLVREPVRDPEGGAGDVLGVGREPQSQGRDIVLVPLGEVFARLDRPPDEHGEHPGRHGVEGAGMPGFLPAENPREPPDGGVGGHARFLFEQDDAAFRIHRVSLRKIKSFVFVARRGAGMSDEMSGVSDMPSRRPMKRRERRGVRCSVGIAR